ncbi:MAG: hypothetical protein QGG42_17700, partial [Phycisphaerae bacterium]|nr:hypothetical protein [Phycisphaerae bacterium]
MSKDRTDRSSKSRASFELTRRELLGVGLSGMLAAAAEPVLGALKLVDDVDNPMEHYPNRGWEKMYRDVFSHDKHYHFMCAPNDTHNCLLRAYVKNDVIT